MDTRELARRLALELQFQADSGLRYLPLRHQPPASAMSLKVLEDVSGRGQPLGERLASLSESKRARLEQLCAKVLSCNKCPNLARSRTQVVFGSGNPDADLMFVGEAPGVEEDRQGEPFVGAAGQLLTRIIEAMGLKREQVYIANVLKCRPDTPSPLSNRKPTPLEISRCVQYLIEQIRIIEPKVLVALGATAVEGLLGRQAAKDGIARLRGQWLEFEGIPLMPTYHPAYVLRNPTLEVKRQVWEDMLKVMEKLGLPITEKQRSYFQKRPAG